MSDCSQTQVWSAKRVLASTHQNLRCWYSKFWRAPALLNKSQDFAFSRALLKCREGTEWLNDHPYKYNKWSQCLKFVHVYSTILCIMLWIQFSNYLSPGFFFSRNTKQCWLIIIFWLFDRTELDRSAWLWRSRTY